MKHISFLLLFIGHIIIANATTKHVLFLGNSYTYVNDLPGMVASVAQSAGDTLIYDTYAPGSYSIGNHSIDPTSIAKIKAGGWDYVVLQGQSYELATSAPEGYAFLYAHNLDTIIRPANPCGETMYYMTWGRENGDSSSCPTIPYYCTYQSMDSIIRLNYMRMADTNKDVVCPVGATRHYIRQHYPGIELYQSDESHPSLAGTYAGACSFYATVFRKDPSLISFNPGLPATDATNIRSAASTVAYDSLRYWHIGQYDSLVHARCSTFTGIADPHPLIQAELFPNPASQTITVYMHTTVRHAVFIYNYMGQLIMKTYISGNTTINISNLLPGNYFLHLENTNQTLSFTKS